MSENLTDLFKEQSFKERIRTIVKGLRAAKDSLEFKNAKFELFRLCGPGSTAIIMGGMMALGAVVFTVSEKIVEVVQTEVTVVQADTVKLEDVKIEEFKPEVKEVEQDVTVDTTVMGPPTDYTAPSDSPGEGNGVGGDLDTPMVVFAPTATKSPLVMKNLYGNRTKGGQKAALAAYGGSAVSEASVVKALKWLKEQQKPDGSWVSPPIAMTGLALLTFLAHGETPASTEYGPTVEKAIKYLLSKQGSTGSWSGSTYENGIACYAMSEAYAMTKIMAIREAMEKGIGYIIKGQHEKGGYHYVYNAPDWDMSCCGWQFQALKAGRMAGASNPELEPAIKRAISLMKDISYANSGEAGGWGYCGSYDKPGGAGVSWTMTSVGTLCMQLLGQAKAKQVRNGLKFLEPQTCKWPEKDAKGTAAKGTAPVYGWYYLTQAKFQEGGSTWNSWNKQFSHELEKSQMDDGHWEGGDHDPGSHVYTTTLCALMLQVYYRYLPSYKHVEDEVGGGADAMKADEISVRVL